MKRVVAVVLLLMLLTPAAVADSKYDAALSALEYSTSMIDLMLASYEMSAEYFDVDDIHLIYSMYEMELGASYTYGALQNYSIKGNSVMGDPPVLNENGRKRLAMTTKNSETYITELFTQWLDGEITNAEFMEKFVPFAKIRLQTDQEVLEALKK